MERILFEAKVISTRSVAASLGGIEDRGLGMDEQGQQMLRRQIAEHGLTMIEPKNFLDSVNIRMKLYEEHAAGQPFRAYINVGGGTTSVGRRAGKMTFKPGLNLKPPSKNLPPDSIMGRFITDRIPVVHLVKIKDFAETYEFPLSPIVRPPIGEGRVFKRERPNQWYAAGLLLTIIGALYLFVRSDLGLRMTRAVRPRGGAGGGSAEPMV
jgi:poly-gamma-glutamate system protein